MEDGPTDHDDNWIVVVVTLVVEAEMFGEEMNASFPQKREIRKQWNTSQHPESICRAARAGSSHRRIGLEWIGECIKMTSFISCAINPRPRFDR